MEELLFETRRLIEKIVSHTKDHCHIQVMGVTVNLFDVYISQGVYILSVQHENIVRREYEVPCDEAHLQEIVNILQAKVDTWK